MFPLVNGLAELVPHWRVIAAPPSTLSRYLVDGVCDAAMLPAYDYLRERDTYGLLEGGCIAARRTAGSVLILSDVPLPESQWVELDAHSRTSNALAKLLLRGPLGLPDLPLVQEPMIEEESGGRPNRHPRTCVRIGDRALRQRGDYAHCIDMAEEWIRWQGLPFVFAVWATRGAGPWAEVAHYLAALRDDNLAHLGERLLANPAVLPRGIDHAAALRYLREDLWYDLGEEERRGLARFGELLDTSE
jgi:chorismate dehydratase